MSGWQKQTPVFGERQYVLLTTTSTLQPPVITLKFFSMCVRLFVCGRMHMCCIEAIVNMRYLPQ